jgi:hypothetical protein
MFMKYARLLVTGLVIWGAATLALRLAGQYLLRPGRAAATLIPFVVSFPLMAALARRMCRAARLHPREWPAGTVWLCLPTLLLDPFSSAFSPAVFPNMAPEIAGVFGGLMLWCCAGALAGVTIPWRMPA